MRKARAWLGILVALVVTGCGRSDTGLHVRAHLGALVYDELRFGVTSAGGEVVVDPMTTGHYQGPFRPGDQDVLIYLRDELGGTEVHCQATALSAGAVVGAGASDVTVVRQEMKDVEIFMAAPGTGGGDASGSGGSSGGGGSSGSGGSAAGGGTTGGGGSTAPPAKSNGEACSVDDECLTHHCADGVCCESDCKMGCHSCALADSLGLCRPVAADAADPHGMCHDQGAASCKQDGLCAVDGTCAVYPAGTVCGQTGSGCDPGGKMVIPAGTCNGAGMCEVPAKIKCDGDTTCVAGVCLGVQNGQR